MSNQCRTLVRACTALSVLPSASVQAFRTLMGVAPLLLTLGACGLKLGYLYVMSTPEPWAVESLSQFKLALKHINAKPDLLRGHNLTFEAHD